MTLKGKAALAVWNDLAPEGRTAFQAWHSKEHVPARLSQSQTLRARRYCAVADGPAYFTLYEATSAKEFQRPLQTTAPSALEQEVEKHFVPGERLLSEVLGTFGAAQGGLLFTCSYPVDLAGLEVKRERLLTHTLPELAQQSEVASCHLLLARYVPISRIVLLVESWDDLPALLARCDRLRTDPALSGLSPVLQAFYRLQASFDARATYAQK
jgi:hypothetical protein